MGFEGDVRAACVTTLEAYASANSVTLQVYRGRPRSIKPPTAFVDVIRETIGYVVAPILQRTVQADVVVLWGLFDSGEAVDQRDAFVDGYVDYIRDQTNFAAAGANSTLGVVNVEDDPIYVPDWQPRDEQRPYFATRLTLEGYIGD